MENGYPVKTVYVRVRTLSEVSKGAKVNTLDDLTGDVRKAREDFIKLYKRGN